MGCFSSPKSVFCFCFSTKRDSISFSFLCPKDTEKNHSKFFQPYMILLSSFLSPSCTHARTHALALGERALINGTTNFLIRLLLWKLSGRAQHQLKCVKTIQGQKSFEKRGKDVITKNSNFYVLKATLVVLMLYYCGK